MALEIINVGASPNDGTGDAIRTAFLKCNDNFTQLFATSGITGLANGTSNISIPLANGNINFSVSGTSNVLVISPVQSELGANLSVAGLATVGNLSVTGGIVSVGTIQSLADVTASVITANANLVAGNAIVGNLITTNELSLTGNVTSDLLVSANIEGANISTPGMISAVGSINSSTDVSAAGNVSAQFILGDGGFLSNVTVASNVAVTQIANGTTVFAVESSGGNINTTVGGTANVLQITSTEISTIGSLSAAGNINGAYILGNGAFLSGLPTQYTDSNVAAYLPTYSGNLSSLGGNVVTSANVTGNNLNATNLVNASNISATNTVSASIVTASGTITGGNLFTSGLISTSGSITSIGNIEGAYLLTTGSVIASGNISGNVISASGAVIGSTVSASGNISGGNIRFNAGVVSGTGNVIAGLVSSSGNVVANLFIGSGAGLFVLPGANVSGAVANATYAVSAGSASTATTATNLSGGTVNATTGSFTGLLTGATSISTDVNTANDTGSFSARGNATTVASMSFHRAGAYAINMGLGTDNVFRIGGWSASNNCLQLTGTGSLSVLNSLTVNSAGSATAIINGAANAVGNIGSSSGYFNRVFAQATTALYADLAELYAADKDYSPGTVVSFGGTQEITISSAAGDTRVAGIVSTNPSYQMNSGLVADHPVAVALQGRVPTQVVGPVRKGDMMVSAGNGVACACAVPTVGSVIGKSLEDFDGSSGIIEIVVGRM